MKVFLNKLAFFFSLFIVSGYGVSEELVTLRKTIFFDGVVVGSTCKVSVESEGSARGVVDFGNYNKSVNSGSALKRFRVIVSENNTASPGCQAFLAGNEMVKLKFGDENSKQLDRYGVVTKGAGDLVRIAIYSEDTGQVSNTNKINSSNNVLLYPKSFAAKGVFSFRALAEGLETATPGSYSGTLSLVVTYK
jgi:type 1 fimbria pilin